MVKIEMYTDGTNVYINSLKNRVVKMTIAEFSNALKGLPAIEEGDDDKVLTVVDGEAAWATVGD